MSNIIESTKKHKAWQFLSKAFLLTLGSLMFAFGVACFLDPNSLAPGGVSGISIIINKFIPAIPTGTLIIIINVPILIIGAVKFGLRFLASTIYSVIVSSLAVNIFSQYVGRITDDLLLAAVAGAVMTGVGIGLVFRMGATTAGTDIIVKLLKLKFRHMKTGMVFTIVDGTVVVISGLVFREFDIVIYAAISLFASTMIMNKVLYGGDGARLIYIISPKNKEIADRFMTDLDAGATFLEGSGAYTEKNVEVLMVALRTRALPQAKDIVKNEDPSAFMIVTNATQVFGEGFRPHDSEEV